MTILAESFSMFESAWVGWSASNRRNCETEASSEMASAAQASLELRGGEMHGFSRADMLGRCARRRLPASKSDEALVLEALQAARFSIFRTIGRCNPAGVLLEDLMRGGAIPLVDEGLEQSAEPGAVFAMRVAPIEEFVITCGAVVPIDHATMEECIALLISAASKAELAALADHRRFAVSIYELAIELGLMNFVDYR
jgi:hypothetical protein